MPSPHLSSSTNISVPLASHSAGMSVEDHQQTPQYSPAATATDATPDSSTDASRAQTGSPIGNSFTTDYAVQSPANDPSAPSTSTDPNHPPQTAIIRTHPMTTRSQNHIFKPKIPSDNFIRYPLPKALLTSLSAATTEPTCYRVRIMYNTILLVRSFRKQDRKRLGYGALAASLLITFSFFTVFNPYLGSLPLLSFRLSTWDDQKLFVVNDSSSCLQMVKEMVRNNKKLINDDGSSRKTVNGTIIEDSLIVNDTSNSQEIATAADADAAAMDEKTELRCNIMGRSEFCEMKGDIRIDGNSSTAFIVSSETDILTAENTSWSIRPYARKEALGEKDFARKWSVKPVTSRLDIARCTRNHSVPAILFSAGGYSGNFFHAFTDIIIPLYSTARTFNREVQFLMTDRKPWWIAKFKTLFEALSRYEIIDIDDRHDVHCFHSLTIGLKGRNNKELSIDSSTSPYSMKDFRKFLRSWYSLKKITAAIIRDGDKRKPRLLIIPRKRSRSFTNVGEIAQLAESLSYQVIVAEPGPDVSGFAKIINSCDVLMGVHGAGLTNIVFLPENAILIQVVPFGMLEWASRASFEDPAKDMNIRYLDYKIKVEESTLIQQYPADHEVLRDPSAIGKQGWVAFRSIYLDKQNVTLDVERFRPTLVKALQLLHQ
ncbi:hypothetical protein DKX38_022260 [Salix brachista]|uniref:Glycosyltransferase 61 catalytic domain-containing protein n=1 Tax=Salix brachista TaxID=2182728 RepID=A0A5N5JZ57_9ROSI|nr:hypothetical protein DKX38_022260 [Salix brachista]